MAFREGFATTSIDHTEAFHDLALIDVVQVKELTGFSDFDIVPGELHFGPGCFPVVAVDQV